MSLEPSDFDIQAALLRQRDAPEELLIYFATKMLAVLPTLTTVEHSGFLGRGSARKVTIALANSRYILELRHGNLSGQRAKIVRGVEIAHEDLPVPVWVAQLTEELRREATQNDTVAQALRHLIFD
ncbi:MAG: hypothetical protein M1298_00465 [Chloroflexi bacterium]|nr:hypothetical protein [Chloroflexota bacterium]